MIIWLKFSHNSTGDRMKTKKKKKKSSSLQAKKIHDHSTYEIKQAIRGKKKD